MDLKGKRQLRQDQMQLLEYEINKEKYNFNRSSQLSANIKLKILNMATRLFVN